MEWPTTSQWHSGSGIPFLFEDLMIVVKSHMSSSSKIFVGTDSFVSKGRVAFATAICLHGGSKPSRYFFFKEYQNKKHYNNLSSRIIEEARRSVELSSLLITKFEINAENIELHLDVSPQHLNNETSKFSSMLKGYISGYGINCKMKPDAWASQSVADKHSK